MQSEQPSCCPKGSWPALNSSYTSKGTSFPLAGTTVYHVGKSDRILIVIEDIFGSTSTRHQSVADTFAEWGYQVFLPELLTEPYSGPIAPEIFECIKRQNYETVESRFKALLDYLTEKGYKEFFAISFCWGVWQGFKLASKYQGFKALVGFHPAIVLEKYLGGSENALAESIQCPAFLFPAGNDETNIKEGGELIEILKKRFGDKAGTHTFEEQTHGWVVRGDLGEANVKRDVEIALREAKEYFEKF